jgi:site-specific DNA recombinase
MQDTSLQQVAAAAYVRVSSAEQAAEGYSLDEQQRLTLERAAAEGAELRPEHLYVDAGISGSRADRPDYQRMLAAAAAGEFTRLFVWRYDRLGRDAEELLRARRMLEAAGVRLASITEGESESTLMYGVRAVVAQEERERIGERTRMGKAAAARLGRPNGGPRRFGFDTSEGQLVPRPDEIAVVEKMMKLALSGMSQTAIALELNRRGHRTAKGHRWSQPRVGQMLRSEIWLGRLQNAEGTFVISEEPFVDAELWEAVQRTLGSSGERRGKPSERFLLSHGLLRCGSCGSAMRVRSEQVHSKPYEHYSCAGRRSGATECTQPAVQRRFVDPAVLEYFRSVALDVEGTVAQLAAEYDRRLGDVQERLKRARQAQFDAELQQERLDQLLREGLGLEEWRRLSIVPGRDREAALLAIEDLGAEHKVIEETGDVIDATDVFVERIAALRAAVAGEVVNAEDVATARAALRRVFHGFVLHRVDSPQAPKQMNAELAFLDGGYLLAPQVREDVLEGVLAGGTPVLKRVPLDLASPHGQAAGDEGGIKASSR